MFFCYFLICIWVCYLILILYFICAPDECSLTTFLRIFFKSPANAHKRCQLFLKKSFTNVRISENVGKLFSLHQHEIKFLFVIYLFFIMFLSFLVYILVCFLCSLWKTKFFPSFPDELFACWSLQVQNTTETTT